MRGALLLLSLLMACGPAPRKSAATHTTTDSAATVAVSDSLVATVSGRTLWFTMARAAQGSGGTCLERSLEIRTDSSRQLVPLLYTREAPMPESDSTVLVHLWNDCAPGPLYRVNLRSGQPVPVRP